MAALISRNPQLVRLHTLCLRQACLLFDDAAYLGGGPGKHGLQEFLQIGPWSGLLKAYISPVWDTGQIPSCMIVIAIPGQTKGRRIKED